MKDGSAIDASSQRHRRWHAKVTSGCLTCRRRRVKCDEQRPNCRTCTRLELVCEGNGYGFNADLDNPNQVPTSFHIMTPSAFEAKMNQQDSDRRQSDSSESTSGASSSTSTDSFNEHDGHTTLPSISSIIGAGRYDPFNTSAVTTISPKDRRLLDHAVYCQWSIFATADKQQNLNTVRSDIMSYAMADPVAWYTIIYAGASHHTYWTRESVDEPEQDLERLSLKTRAIRALIEALNNRNGEISDEILISMVILSAHGNGESVRRAIRGKVQSRKTLLRAMDAEYYGTLEPGVEHLRVLYKLIERRGGIQSIRSRAVQVATILFDVWNSWKILSPPGFPKLQPLSNFLKLRTWASDMKAERMYNTLTQSLNAMVRMTNVLEHSTLLEIVECLRVLTTDLDQIRRTPKFESVISAPSQPTLIWIRSMSMHTLLSLPDYSTNALTTQDIQAREYLIYELCRISCFMYGQVWLYPVVSKKINMARVLLSKMCPLLTAAATPSTSEVALNVQHPDFFLWGLILSLMCAYEDFDMTGNQRSMQQVLGFLRNIHVEPSPGSWSQISDILDAFLWSRADCELTGRDAWQRACDMLPSSSSITNYKSDFLR